MGTLFKRLLREAAPVEYQIEDGRLVTSAEVLAKRILADALRGDRNMRDLVVAYTEGKPGTKQEQKVADTSIEDQIDRAAVAHLNSFLPQAEEQ